MPRSSVRVVGTVLLDRHQVSAKDEDHPPRPTHPGRAFAYARSTSAAPMTPGTGARSLIGIRPPARRSQQASLPQPRTSRRVERHGAGDQAPASAWRTARAAAPRPDRCRRRRRSPSVASLLTKGCRGVAVSGQASSADHGVDAGACYGPRTVLSNDQLPSASIERGERRVDRDLHLTCGGRCGPGDRVDRAVADQQQGPPGATPVAIRRAISCTEPATWTYRHVTRS